ncbi:MAG TPA: response regulator [Candidatus Angelobacter sp.]|nr:response regulator [Candidatus Angelobacter sp.]
MRPNTVLLVDDDLTHLTLHSMLLKNAGFRPITALVGSESVSFHENERPILIFMDYRLNTSIGPIQAGRLLRHAFPGIPIVVLSSDDSMPAEMKCVADGFVRKGDPRDLIAAAERFRRSPA